MDRHNTRREVLNFKCWCSKSMLGTKKGEKPEPSSPKVSCIGQVRVKKQGKRLRSRSKRRGGDVRFRQEQRWVQLPVTICRAFGADRNCLLPCRAKSSSCCGALFRRKERDIDKEPTGSCRSRRRHVFEDINIEAEGFEVCAPPKNALLLMRCRSDPLKMANRFYQHNESNLGLSSPAKLTDSQFLLNQDIESESQHNSEQQSETQVEVEVQVLAVVTEEETETAIQEQESGRKSTEEGASQQLPECLMMMMMYEPKLSMEVSKETWVSTTDFIRCLPVIKTDVQDERISMDASTAHPPPVQQAARSSCSYPAASNAFEPLALTRCKSEPKRSASKLAPHRPRIGAGC